MRPAIPVITVALFCILSSTLANARPRDHDPDAIQVTPPLTVKDVINLAKAGASDSLTIGEIEASYSRFHLTADDIIMLKGSGVSETVINAMIGSGAQDVSAPPERMDEDAPFGYWPSFWNYPSWNFAYPYYPSYYYGPGGWPYLLGHHERLHDGFRARRPFHGVGIGHRGFELMHRSGEGFSHFHTR